MGKTNLHDLRKILLPTYKIGVPNVQNSLRLQLPEESPTLNASRRSTAGKISTYFGLTCLGLLGFTKFVFDI